MHLVITETSKLVSITTRALRIVAVSFYVLNNSSAVFCIVVSDLFHRLVFPTPDHAIRWVAKVARHQ